MLRIGLALTLIAWIFFHSPHRQSDSSMASVTAMTRQASQIVGTMAGSEFGPVLAETVLRKTLADALPPARAPSAEPEGPEIAVPHR